MIQNSLDEWNNAIPQLEPEKQILIEYTKPLLNESTIKFRQDLAAKVRSVKVLFPELQAKRILLSLTTTARANAQTNGDFTNVIRIGVNPKEKLPYYIIGHEFTHFIQEFMRRQENPSRIPYGEKACDIWTIARDDLFTDFPPIYLKVPGRIRKKWDMFKKDIRQCCILAIEKRKTERRYIHWCENEIKSIGK